MHSPAVRLLAWLVAALVAAGASALIARAGAAPGTPASPWRLALGRLRRDRVAMLALWLLVTLAAAAALAPLLAPWDPIYIPHSTAMQFEPPSGAHPFGTDQHGRDVLSRMLFGARVSLGVAFLAVALAASIGTAYGAVAGYFDRLGGPMMRLLDALLSIPRILLLLGVVALWGGSVSLPAVVLILGLTGWFGVSRQVRAQVLAARTQEYALAARALGAGDGRVLGRHLLPNVLSPVIVAATLGIGNTIIAEAGLSYLGFGVQPPAASWGSIIQDATSDIAGHWWLSLFPGGAIVLTVMAVNVLGDALRDALDPRS